MWFGGHGDQGAGGRRAEAAQRAAGRPGPRRAARATIIVAVGGVLVWFGMARLAGSPAAAGGPGAVQAARDGYLPHLISGGYPPTATPYGTPPTTPTRRPWPTRRPPRPRAGVAVSGAAEATPVLPAGALASGPHLRIAAEGGSLLTGRSVAASPAGRRAPAARPLGMISFGESVIELQNRWRSEQTINVLLHSLDGFDDVPTSRRLAPLASGSIVLRDDPKVTYSNYTGRLTPSDGLGSLARTTWDAGAMAVYEEPEPATEAILPLFAKEVYSHTTLVWLTNLNADWGDDITMTVHDTDGSVLSEWAFWLDPGGSGVIDPFYPAEFGQLPTNVGDGFMGTAILRCSSLTAIAAYGDDSAGRGVTGFVARPIEAADTVQLLPVVRANVEGDTLLSVANTENHPAEVTISYVGADDSPSGAGRTYQQELTIGPRHWAFVDLDPVRRRGNVDVPALPRGNGADRGFIGAATVRSSVPVLALALDQAVLAPVQGVYTVTASAAYNAFGRADLATTWVVPHAFAVPNGRRTDVVVMNPGPERATFRVDWGHLPDDLTGTSGQITLEPGEADTVPVAPDVTDPGAPTDLQAVVRADAAVAVVVYDHGTDLDRTAYPAIQIDAEELEGVATVVSPPTETPVPSATATAGSATAAPTDAAPGTATASASATIPRGNAVYLPLTYRRWPR